MVFAADKNAAVFGGVKIFVEDYSVERAAAVSETALLSGTSALHFGGGSTAKIRLSGTTSEPAAVALDGLLTSGTEFTLTYKGMVFEGVSLVKYSCAGKSGESERVAAEFRFGGSVADEEE